MLRIEDRIEVAISGGMGIALTPEETVHLGRLLALYQITQSRGSLSSRFAATYHDALAQLFPGDGT